MARGLFKYRPLSYPGRHHLVGVGVHVSEDFPRIVVKDEVPVVLAGVWCQAKVVNFVNQVLGRRCKLS